MQQIFLKAKIRKVLLKKIIVKFNDDEIEILKKLNEGSD